MKVLACLAAVSLAVGVSAVAAAAPEARPTPKNPTGSPTIEPLSILLSNDDGVGQGGLPELRDALCEAGHEVTLAAPATNQSGAGGSFTGSGTLKVESTGPACANGGGATYTVHGTPADSVLFGLSVTEAEPDLVITGINPGQNVADAMSVSGTIGAAMISAKERIPTLSISVEVDAEDFERNGTHGQTDAAVTDAAHYTVELVRHLSSTIRGSAGLPEGLFLNIAYPVVLDEGGHHDPSLVRGTKVTRAGDYPVLGGVGEFIRSKQVGRTTWYDVSTPGFCRVEFPCPPETSHHADSTALERDFVSITPLETAFGAERGSRTRGLLGGFTP